MKKINLSGINTATWVRSIVFFLTLANQLSVSVFEFKLLPWGEDDMYESVSMMVTAVMSILAYWKNNSVTKEAQEADEVLAVKKGLN